MIKVIVKKYHLFPLPIIVIIESSGCTNAILNKPNLALQQLNTSHNKINRSLVSFPILFLHINREKTE